MSKNFELMQEILKETEITRERPASAQPDPVLFPSIAVESAATPVTKFDRAAQEECLRLVQRVFLAVPSLSRAIVYAGVDRGDGCSRICIETARILASNTNSPVCIVDANLRNPSLPDSFGVTNHRGLSNALLEEGSVQSFATQLKPNLWLLSAGALTAASPALLNSDRLTSRLRELREEFRYILIDAPALNVHADAITLARNADGMVIVLQAEATRRESAVKAIASVRQANIEVLGAVLNRRTFPIPEFLYRRL